MAEDRRVLVTGATGLVGAEVTARLARCGFRVTAMVHESRELVRNNGARLRSVRSVDPPRGKVAIVSGDVARPRLGLSREDYERLRSATDLVVHSAAITDFGRPPALYRQVNVEGTAHVVDFVRAAPRPIALLHVSTAYVCGERSGSIREDELDVGQRFANDYEESKFEAEKRVRAAAASGVPVVVARPSIVVGAARSGAVRDFKNMYPVLKVMTRGLVRSVPGQYDALLDLVPVDYVAASVATLAERFDRVRGGTYHIVSGAPLSLGDFSDVLAEYPPFHVPRFVPPSSFDPARMDPIERRYYEEVVGLYESYLRRHVRFANDGALDAVGRSAGTGGRPFLRRLLDYCLRVGYLGGTLASVADVLQSVDEDLRSAQA